nr:aminotransferase class I/II-fold pyridoxal phosphate-dependent enzyme [Actinomycetota bacterium]
VLSYREQLLGTVGSLCQQRDRIVSAAAQLGLRAVPSDANFVLIGGFHDSRAAWRALLDHGVLVRDVDIPGHLRITAGTPAETDALLDALRAISGVPARRPLPSA